MSAAAYAVEIDYAARLVMGRDGTPLHAYRTTRNGVRFGPLHANPESARAAANLALYQETQGYPPLTLAAHVTEEGVVSDV